MPREREEHVLERGRDGLEVGDVQAMRGHALDDGGGQILPASVDRVPALVHLDAAVRGGVSTEKLRSLMADVAQDHSETVDKMNEKYGKLYSTSTIKAGSYPGYDKDNKIAEVWNLIVTNDKMSNDDAYAIVKTLVEKKADIVAVHKEALSFSLDNQVQARSPVPFHPGALKYFKEKGIGG